jgi:energy-coupling factor transporter ATP-binding protein EcfA2
MPLGAEHVGRSFRAQAMITGIEVRGLRGIREGKIEGLAPLTLLVGPNGCGKSTVLEALGVACAGRSAKAVFEALSTREWLGLKGLGYWLANGSMEVVGFFEPGRTQDEVQFSSKTKVSYAMDVPGVEAAVRAAGEPGSFAVLDAILESNSGRIAINQDGCIVWSSRQSASIVPFTLQSAFVDRPAGALKRFSGSRFSSALRDALTDLKLSPWYDDLFAYLQVLRPKISSIESIAVGDRDEPHIFERDPRVGYPLAYAGDGFRRSLLLAGAFARAKGGVAAIDEPEAFAHPGMFSALSGLVRRAIADQTQVVMATHSLEFVAAALREFEGDPEKVAVVGLRMEGGVLDPLVVTGADAQKRVLELGHDLRL